MNRYGIAEWYGNSLLTLSPSDRRALAEIAMGNGSPPQCPFRPMTCNKRGGVCSLQQYEESEGRITGVTGSPVIVCPSRFEQDLVIVRWLADIVGFSSDAVMLAREIPFMRSTATGKHAGMIDLVVASEEDGFRWFGLEVQAVYFSGAGMNNDFAALRLGVDVAPPCPTGNRRPDWRSSSAKRLMPQLQVKGPTLRRWGSKFAVAVDAPFFASMGGPSTTPSHDLDSGDVVWLVPEVQEGRLIRGHWEVLTLEASEVKLLAAEDITRADFERVLREKLSPLDAEGSQYGTEG